MKRHSITRRLIVSVVLTQLILTAAVVVLASYLTNRQLRNAFDSALHGRAMSVAALVRFSEDEHPRLVFDKQMSPPPLEPKHRDMFEIIGSDGNLIATSPNWNSHLVSSARAGSQFWTAHLGDESYRVIQLRNIPVLDSEGPNAVGSPTITVLYAASSEEIQQRIWAVAISTLVGSLLLLGIATAITVWAVRRGLSPLSQLAKSASQVTVTDWALHAPDEAHETVELGPLTEAMDRMLATLERAFTSQREFVANAAHELKTPIAVLKSTLQLALQRPRTADEYRHQLKDALDDVARLETLTHSMLRLARAEQLQRRSHDLSLVDLAATCESSAERWRPVAQAKAVEIQVQSLADPQIHGDPDDLEMIWNNLLDNAVRYSPHGAEIRVSLARENGDARIEVADQGPGIPEDELKNIFDRFRRADASRSRETGGYGLGLAIAKAMVEAYGGRIAAESRPGSGTTFSVHLPITS